MNHQNALGTRWYFLRTSWYRLIGIGCNTHGLSDSEARAAVERAEAETGPPATDVLRFGAEKLAQVVLNVPRPCA